LIVGAFRLTWRSQDEAPHDHAHVTAKGQVTLRKDLLQHLSVHPGDKITVDKLPDGRLEMKAVRPTGKISDVFDTLKRKNGPSLSLDEINEVATRSWADRR
jgi:bifunctional DNA-binding transcriptional regulator/antitoxin component of YhaV-PrlF toxin-antitoxin module